MQPIEIDGIVFRPYEHGSRDDMKGYILRCTAMNLFPIPDESAVDFMYGDHENEENRIKLGAFLGDGMAGTVCLVPQDEKTALLCQFAVSTKLQGKGIGRKLLAYTHAAAKELGFTRIVLDARQNAYEFYCKAGYIPTGEQRVFPNLVLHKMYIDL